MAFADGNTIRRERERMEINVREDKRLVEIWLRRDEGDAALLRPLYARYGALGYGVAVYRSGGEDLAGLTAGLLVTNRQKLAGRPPSPGAPADAARPGGGRA